jgi:ABC-type multidrug transport system ATPase subunit
MVSRFIDGKGFCKFCKSHLIFWICKGAGKSTLSSILSCELNASSGEASIFGFDTRRHQFDVRCLIGLCKQDDFLYPDLSAKEHLDIFAGLRGVNMESHESVVQKWLTSVDLINDQHKFSKDFSGGMKRRLSVALSTVGDRPFIILDVSEDLSETYIPYSFHRAYILRMQT